MKRQLITILLTAAANITLSAETHIDRILQSIESNNLTLAALWNENTSQKYANTGQVTLPDPEVGFTYLWGRPSEAGTKKQISATQSFDLTTLLGHKGAVARSQNALLDIEYRKARRAILLEAKKYCYQVIYHNAVEAELNKQLCCATHLSDAYGKAIQDGNTNVLEYNRARLSVILLQGELRKNGIARDEALTQLAKLNGGNPVTLTDTTFAQIAPLPPFDIWYAQALATDPELEYAANLVQLRNNEVRLGKSVWAPTITAGYAAEIDFSVSDFHKKQFSNFYIFCILAQKQNKSKKKETHIIFFSANRRRGSCFSGPARKPVPFPGRFQRNKNVQNPGKIVPAGFILVHLRYIS